MSLDPKLYPFTPKSFDRNGLKMSYLDEGTGEPVVMVHGNPTWSFYFRNLVLALRDKYRCIVPDHIGCGLSDKPTFENVSPRTPSVGQREPLKKPTDAVRGLGYDYTLQSRIDDLEALINSLHLPSKITLVVQDWGGMIGMGYAARHPDRIARIVATNTGCTRLPASKKLPPSLWLGRNTWLGRWLILHRNYFCRKALKWCVKRKPLPADVQAMYLAPYDSPANRIAVLKFVQTIPLKPTDPGYDIVVSVEESLKQFQNVPTLLLWGMKDFVFDEHFLAEWQRHFPHAETHTWPDCGHYLLEDAGEEVFGKIQQFLDSTQTRV